MAHTKTWQNMHECDEILFLQCLLLWQTDKFKYKYHCLPKITRTTRDKLFKLHVQLETNYSNYTYN